MTPVYKKNDEQIISNYTPISLLPILNVCEKIIFENLYVYLNANNLINTNQSGFRPEDSCSNQSFDCGLEVRLVHLDMCKAFDRV